MCHNSLLICLFYYILAFVHTGSLLFYSFLIVLAIDDFCRSGTFASCISSVSCTPLHPSSYWLVCVHRQVFTYKLSNISSSYWLVYVHSCRPPFFPQLRFNTVTCSKVTHSTTLPISPSIKYIAITKWYCISQIIPQPVTTLQLFWIGTFNTLTSRQHFCMVFYLSLKLSL